jgi:hypothetical protein
MATNGFDATTGALVIAAINGGTAVTFTTPLKVLFNSAQRTADNGTDTEWVAGGGYTVGTGFSGLTFAAATTDATGAHQASNVLVTLANILNNSTWAGNTVKDTSGTPKQTWWATLASSKTVNSGDTVSIASGSLTTNMG